MTINSGVNFEDQTVNISSLQIENAINHTLIDEILKQFDADAFLKKYGNWTFPDSLIPQILQDWDSENVNIPTNLVSEKPLVNVNNYNW